MSADSSVGQFFNLITTGFAVFAAILGFFWKLEEVVSAPAKKATVRWILRLEIAQPSQWPDQFIMLFDRLFGTRHFSIRCFMRSSLASVAAVLLLFLMWASLRQDEAQAFFAVLQVSSLGVVNVIVLFVCANLLPDYLSLLQTRWLIKRAADARTGLRVAVLLILDVVLSALLFVIGAGVMFYILFLVPFNAEYEVSVGFVPYLQSLFRETIAYGLVLSVGEQGAVSAGVFFYSAFFTTIWAWLYACSSGLVRLCAGSGAVLRRLKWLLDIEHHPLRSLGVIAGGLSAVLYWVIGVLVLVID